MKRRLVRACLAYLAVGLVATVVLAYPGYRFATPAHLAFAIVAWPYMVFYAIGMNLHR
jgi:hypothetical protein